MRRTATTAFAFMLALSHLVIISQAAFFETPRAAKRCVSRIRFDLPAVAPLETIIDCVAASDTYETPQPAAARQ